MISKYIIFFEVNKNLFNDFTTPPSFGLHSTVYFFTMNSQKESELKMKLLKEKINKVTTQTLNFDIFDKESLVIKLDEKGLLRLRREIEQLVLPKVDNVGLVKSFLYNPHITLARKSKIPQNSIDFKGLIISVSSLFLSKKTKQGWIKILEIPLK